MEPPCVSPSLPNHTHIPTLRLACSVQRGDEIVSTRTKLHSHVGHAREDGRAWVSPRRVLLPCNSIMPWAGDPHDVMSGGISFKAEEALFVFVKPQTLPRILNPEQQPNPGPSDSLPRRRRWSSARLSWTCCRRLRASLTVSPSPSPSPSFSPSLSLFLSLHLPGQHHTSREPSPCPCSPHLLLFCPFYQHPCITPRC
jgi:hypothetical protein